MAFSDLLARSYPCTEQQRQRIWAEADFCLDANILLNVYRYSDERRDEFFALLKKIETRLFVPHRVAFEFIRNRINVIYEHFAPQRLVRQKLEATHKDLEKYKTHAEYANISKLLDDMKQLLSDEYDELEKKHLGLINDDLVLEELLRVVDAKVGEAFPEDKAKNDYDRRKQDNIPPYCKDDDSNKELDDAMGDVVIWLEILHKYSETSKPLIFVTADRKDNWWVKSKGGRWIPQPHLVGELYDCSKSSCLFYTADGFMKSAPDRLKVEVSEDLIEETREIRERQHVTPKRQSMSNLERAFRDQILSNEPNEEIRQRIWEQEVMKAVRSHRRIEDQLHPFETIMAQAKEQEEMRKTAESHLKPLVDPLAQIKENAAILETARSQFKQHEELLSEPIKQMKAYQDLVDSTARQYKELGSMVRQSQEEAKKYTQMMNDIKNGSSGK